MFINNDSELSINEIKRRVNELAEDYNAGASLPKRLQAAEIFKAFIKRRFSKSKKPKGLSYQPAANPD